MKSLCMETREAPLLTATKEKPMCNNEDQVQPKVNKWKGKKNKIIMIDNEFDDKDIMHCSGGGTI